MCGETPLIDVDQVDDVTVIGFAGKFDSLNADFMLRAEQSVLTAVDSAAVPNVVFDLTETDFLGSAFLQMLVRSWHRTGNRGGQMALCGLQDFCRQVVVTSGLDRLWALYPTRKDAVNALRQS